MEAREIDKKALKTVCLIGQAEKTCRYVGVAKYFECLKLTGAKALLDDRVKKGEAIAIGDNCEGLA